MPNKRTVEKRVADFAAACREGGVRVTHQRTEVFRELAGSREHPTADELYERVRARIPSMSRDTVYRTLAFLEERGLVDRVTGVTGPARFDGAAESHHHFVCTSCGRIEDFQSEQLDGFAPPPGVKRFGTVHRVQVQLKGVCNDCRRRMKSKP